MHFIRRQKSHMSDCVASFHAAINGFNYHCYFDIPARKFYSRFTIRITDFSLSTEATFAVVLSAVKVSEGLLSALHLVSEED